MKYIKYFALIFTMLVTTVWLGIKDAIVPMKRTEISQAIYTIGDGNYKTALNDGKNIVKFGPMFWKLYPGGMAFATPNQARDFIQNNKEGLDQFSSGWAIYQLSGDLSLDTYQIDKQRYLNKSLFIKSIVNHP